MEHSLNPYQARVAAAQIIALAINSDISSVCRYACHTPYWNCAVLYFINDTASQSATFLFFKPGFEYFHAIDYALTHFSHRLI